MGHTSPNLRHPPTHRIGKLLCLLLSFPALSTALFCPSLLRVLFFVAHVLVSIYVLSCIFNRWNSLCRLLAFLAFQSPPRNSIFDFHYLVWLIGLRADVVYTQTLMNYTRGLYHITQSSLWLNTSPTNLERDAPEAIDVTRRCRNGVTSGTSFSLENNDHVHRRSFRGALGLSP